MEGIGGISHSLPTERADPGYPAAVALMVGEANAAIEGAFVGGATDVLVNDSHGQMFNLTPEDLDPRAVLDRKSTRLNSSHSQIWYAVFCLKKAHTAKINK